MKSWSQCCENTSKTSGLSASSTTCSKQGTWRIGTGTRPIVEHHRVRLSALSYPIFIWTSSTNTLKQNFSPNIPEAKGGSAINNGLLSDRKSRVTEGKETERGLTNLTDKRDSSLLGTLMIPTSDD